MPDTTTTKHDITQFQLDSQITMARLDTKVDHLEGMQKHLYGKMDGFVDEMKVLVHEVTTAHKDLAENYFISKDSYYQREQELKKAFEVELHTLDDKLNTLKMRVTQIFTTFAVLLAGLQLGLKYLV